MRACVLLFAVALCTTRAADTTPTELCAVPSSRGATLNVTSPCLLSCANATACLIELDTLRVAPEGEVHFDASIGATTLRVRILEVAGALVAGSEAAPFGARLDILLTGESADQDDGSVAKVAAGSLPYSKVLLAKGGARLELHGAPKTPWLKLAATARAGDDTVTLVGVPIGWVEGDTLLLPTTGTRVVVV